MSNLFAEAIFNANAFRSRSAHGNSIAIHKGNCVMSMNGGGSVYVAYPAIPWQQLRLFVAKQLRDVMSTYKLLTGDIRMETIFLHHQKPAVVKPLRKGDVAAALQFIDSETPSQLELVAAGHKWSLDLAVKYNGGTVYPEPLPQWIPVEAIEAQVLFLLKGSKFYPITNGTFRDVWRERATIPKDTHGRMVCLHQKNRFLFLSYPTEEGKSVRTFTLATKLPKSAKIAPTWFDFGQFQQDVFTAPLEVGVADCGALFRWGVHRVLLFTPEKFRGTPPPVGD